MNIFAYHKCPTQCALWLDDRRKNKMILESAQMLSTAIRYLEPTDDRVYKPTHPHHPCNKWLRESRHNFMWLIKHMEAMANQKHGPHKSARLLPLFKSYFKHPGWSSYVNYQTPFVNCARNDKLGLNFTALPDVHAAYRAYHKCRWNIDTDNALAGVPYAEPPRWEWGEEPKWRKQ